MGMILNYEELFKSYTGDGHTLDNAIKYLIKQASVKGISRDVMELAIQETFTEMIGGREFSKTKCSCGCGIDKAATDLIHYIERKMVSIDKDLVVATTKILNDRHNTVILGHIQAQNREYSEKNLKPFFLFDWNKSEVLKWTGLQ